VPSTASSACSATRINVTDMGGDVLSIAIALVVFAVLLLTIELLERI
jgi:hypothetical protein